MSEPKLRFTRQLPKQDFGLLNQMSAKAFPDQRDFIIEETIRKDWEDDVKKLPMSQLKIASVNYDLFRETKLIELTNKTA